MTLCPLCGEDYAQEDLGEVTRGGGKWLMWYCYWCGEDYVIPAEWDGWSAWCPGCGDRADPAYERVGVLARCDRDACAVRFFEPWHDWFDGFGEE